GQADISKLGVCRTVGDLPLCWSSRGTKQRAVQARGDEVIDRGALFLEGGALFVLRPARWVCGSNRRGRLKARITGIKLASKYRGQQRSSGPKKYRNTITHSGLLRFTSGGPNFDATICFEPILRLGLAQHALNVHTAQLQSGIGQLRAALPFLMPPLRRRQ